MFRRRISSSSPEQGDASSGQDGSETSGRSESLRRRLGRQLVRWTSTDGGRLTRSSGKIVSNGSGQHMTGSGESVSCDSWSMHCTERLRSPDATVAGMKVVARRGLPDRPVYLRCEYWMALLGHVSEPWSVSARRERWEAYADIKRAVLGDVAAAVRRRKEHAAAVARATQAANDSDATTGDGEANDEDSRQDGDGGDDTVSESASEEQSGLNASGKGDKGQRTGSACSAAEHRLQRKRAERSARDAQVKAPESSIACGIGDDEFVRRQGLFEQVVVDLIRTGTCFHFVQQGRGARSRRSGTSSGTDCMDSTERTGDSGVQSGTMSTEEGMGETVSESEGLGDSQEGGNESGEATNENSEAAASLLAVERTGEQAAESAAWDTCACVTKGVDGCCRVSNETVWDMLDLHAAARAFDCAFYFIKRVVIH